MYNYTNCFFSAFWFLHVRSINLVIVYCIPEKEYSRATNSGLAAAVVSWMVVVVHLTSLLCVKRSPRFQHSLSSTSIFTSMPAKRRHNHGRFRAKATHSPSPKRQQGSSATSSQQAPSPEKTIEEANAMGLKIYCVKCEESCEIDSSRKATKTNELKRICLHCDNHDAGRVRATKQDSAARLEWKLKPHTEKVQEYKKSRKARELNGGRAAYGENKNIHGKVKEIAQNMTLKDKKKHFLTFTQFAMQVMTLKLAANLEEADLLWQKELKRDDRVSVWENDQWHLEDYQGIDLISRSASGTEVERVQQSNLSTVNDMEDFKAISDELMNKRRRANDNIVSSSISQVKAKPTQAYEVDGVSNIDDLAGVGSSMSSFEAFLMKDMLPGLLRNIL